MLPMSRPDPTQFWSLKISRSAISVKSWNVAQPIINLQNCVRLGRDVSEACEIDGSFRALISVWNNKESGCRIVEGVAFLVHSGKLMFFSLFFVGKHTNLFFFYLNETTVFRLSMFNNSQQSPNDKVKFKCKLLKISCWEKPSKVK